MGVFARFERVPGDEFRDDQDVILSAYPQHASSGLMNDTKGNYERMTQHEVLDDTIHRAIGRS